MLGVGELAYLANTGRDLGGRCDFVLAVELGNSLVVGAWGERGLCYVGSGGDAGWQGVWHGTYRRGLC